MELKASEVAYVVGGDFLGEDKYISGFCINSKEIREGQVFVAIKGQKHDGHDFLKEAFQKGAVGTLVEKNVHVPNGKFAIRVKSSLEALRNLASWKRKRFKGKVVGIAGSAGKTTTKEMTAFLLSKVGRVCKTPRNFNSQITVPLSLCNFSTEADFWVVEMGASQKGDVKRLVEVVKPQVRAITAIGEEHLETFGCLDDVVLGNGEILYDMKEDEFGIYPDYVAHCYSCDRYITFGERSRFRAEEVKLDHTGVHFRVDGVHIFVPIPSLAVVENALCSLAILEALGIDWKVLCKELREFHPVEGRFKVIKRNNITIIDDTYNANPPSMKKALQTLSHFGGIKVAVLGDMLELGKNSELYHREIGRFCVEMGMDYSIFYGEHMRHAYEECRSLGGNCFYFTKKGDVMAFLGNLLKDREEKTLLFKGSRGMRMEEFIEGLTRVL